MSWVSKALKKIGSGGRAEPIPQHFSDKIDDFEPTKGEDGALFVKVKNNVVEDYWQGSSNITKTFSTSMTGVSIANDGIANMTFTINGTTRTVYPGEVYTANFKSSFTSITITASDLYRAEVLS